MQKNGLSPMKVQGYVVWFFDKQDSKELSPRPLANAPKTFNLKKNS